MHDLKFREQHLEHTTAIAHVMNWNNYRLIAITLKGCVPEYQWEGFNAVQIALFCKEQNLLDGNVAG